jgi:hypothetical protein
VVVVGHCAGAVVVVVVVPLVGVLGHGTVVVVVLDVVVGVVVVVVGGGAVVVGVVGGNVVVVVPGSGGRVVGGEVGDGEVGDGAAGEVGRDVPAGLVDPTVVPSPARRGKVVPPAATPLRSGASVETWRPVDDPPAADPRMLAHASSCEVTERSQFTSGGSSPPLNHLRARMKSPQRSVSSRTLGRNPTAMLTAAMS